MRFDLLSLDPNHKKKKKILSFGSLFDHSEQNTNYILEIKYSKTKTIQKSTDVFYQLRKYFSKTKKKFYTKNPYLRLIMGKMEDLIALGSDIPKKKTLINTYWCLLLS